MKNTELWDAVKQPPKSALKPIAAGRLKGKTDISPQWRMLVLTEQFGPCGVGWKYTIDRVWSEPCPDGQVLAFAEVSLFTFSDKWSEPIPGIGGSKLITKESSGLYVNDEGYKMAVTDALSVACKAIGVAADVYMGLWDGSKYNVIPTTPPPSQPKPKQILFGKMKDAGMDNEEAKKFFSYVGAKTDKELQTFIDGFDAQLESWKVEKDLM
jgi:hypothetical protein